MSSISWWCLYYYDLFLYVCVGYAAVVICAVDSRVAVPASRACCCICSALFAVSAASSCCTAARSNHRLSPAVARTLTVTACHCVYYVRRCLGRLVVCTVLDSYNVVDKHFSHRQHILVVLGDSTKPGPMKSGNSDIGLGSQNKVKDRVRARVRN